MTEHEIMLQVNNTPNAKDNETYCLDYMIKTGFYACVMWRFFNGKITALFTVIRDTDPKRIEAGFCRTCKGAVGKTRALQILETKMHEGNVIELDAVTQ